MNLDYSTTQSVNESWRAYVFAMNSGSREDSHGSDTRFGSHSQTTCMYTHAYIFCFPPCQNLPHNLLLPFEKERGCTKTVTTCRNCTKISSFCLLFFAACVTHVMLKIHVSHTYVIKQMPGQELHIISCDSPHW